MTGLKDSEIEALMRDIDAAITLTSMELENTKTLQQQTENQMRQWEEQYRVAADSLQRAREEQDGNEISPALLVRHHAPSICTDWSCDRKCTNLHHLT